MPKGKSKKARARAVMPDKKPARRKQDEAEKHMGSEITYGTLPGLDNLGNTCFFNSVLQNLAALDVLRKRYGSARSDEELDAEEGQIQTAFRSFLTEFTSCKGKSFNPKQLFSAVCKRAPRFKSMQQQDSHELLRYFLDGLQMEENDFVKKLAEVNAASDPASGGRDPGLNTVDNYFCGELVWSITCTVCNSVSSVTEPFMDLSLPVPAPPEPSPPKTRQQKTRHADTMAVAMVPCATSYAPSDPNERYLSAKERKRLHKEARREAKRGKGKAGEDVGAGEGGAEDQQEMPQASADVTCHAPPAAKAPAEAPADVICLPTPAEEVQAEAPADVICLPPPAEEVQAEAPADAICLPPPTVEASADAPAPAAEKVICVLAPSANALGVDVSLHVHDNEVISEGWLMFEEALAAGTLSDGAVVDTDDNAGTDDDDALSVIVADGGSPKYGIQDRLAQ
ncbi:ubiquitin-specific protease ubp2, variant 2 [Cymbomonas tetramitiformis]|uniref:Ubiquitin-specific protease ubp2, variant 2 n=1 Tax=Cymbomonas tetramitiformis TaxID=36881 RepID=A0AAE0GHS1_9CHLO|nr:ubiquitin-specific protease ubp2, variant 2 [Cymbomonas tetramitiformis]